MTAKLLEETSRGWLRWYQEKPQGKVAHAGLHLSPKARAGKARGHCGHHVEVRGALGVVQQRLEEVQAHRLKELRGSGGIGGWGGWRGLPS